MVVVVVGGVRRWGARGGIHGKGGRGSRLITVEGEFKDRGCGRHRRGGEMQSSTIVVVVVVGGVRRWGDGELDCEIHGKGDKGKWVFEGFYFYY